MTKDYIDKVIDSLISQHGIYDNIVSRMYIPFSDYQELSKEICINQSGIIYYRGVYIDFNSELKNDGIIFRELKKDNLFHDLKIQLA